MTNKKQRYALLKLKPQREDVFLLVEEPGTFEHECAGVCDFCRDNFEEKTCAVDFISGARQIIVGNNADPHHIFEIASIVEADSPEAALLRFREAGAVAQQPSHDEVKI